MAGNGGTRARELLLEGVRAALRGAPLDPGCGGTHADWSALRDAAKRHHVAPLIHEALHDSPLRPVLAEDVRRSLLLEYARTGMRNEVIAPNLAGILAAAVDRGIPLMLLKGAVLAFSEYRRPEHRGLGDVDLLVRESDFEGLRSMLHDHGYTTSAPALSARDAPGYAHSVRQIRFEGRLRVPIEVHFRLLNLGPVSDTEPAWDDAEPHDFCGIPACRPSAERFLLHLCLHAQQHRFAVLRLLVDIAVWRASHHVDSDEFVALARQSHLGPAAYYALTYARDLLGPSGGGDEQIRSRLEPPRWKRRFLERVWDDSRVRTLLADPGPLEVGLPRVFLLSDAPLSQKLAFLRSVLLPPRGWLPTDRRRHLGRVLRGARHVVSASPGHSSGRALRPAERPETSLDLPDRPKARRNLAMREVEGELIVYEAATDQAVLLNSSAAVIFELCDGTRSMDDIAAEVRSVFDGPHPAIESDVRRTVRDLVARNLLERPRTLPPGTAT